MLFLLFRMQWGYRKRILIRSGPKCMGPRICGTMWTALTRRERNWALAAAWNQKSNVEMMSLCSMCTIVYILKNIMVTVYVFACDSHCFTFSTWKSIVCCVTVSLLLTNKEQLKKLACDLFRTFATHSSRVYEYGILDTDCQPQNGSTFSWVLSTFVFLKKYHSVCVCN